jgi:hypothetical protein
MTTSAQEYPCRLAASPIRPFRNQPARPGNTNGEAADFDPRAQSGKYLTTAQGLRLPDADHSLKAGDRGPSLLEDFHLREKITHFDHERIPELVVHARSAAAHGVFESYGTAASVTKASFLAKLRRARRLRSSAGFRRSWVRVSADTVRDTRGFAVKFYTDECNFDLVGNNIPVFFILRRARRPLNNRRASLVYRLELGRLVRAGCGAGGSGTAGRAGSGWSSGVGGQYVRVPGCPPSGSVL